jgi:monoterpene epsilon-lactone hydrolase
MTMANQAESPSEYGIHTTRFIPVPKSISQQAQDVLGMGMLYQGDGGGDPEPDDVEGWRTMVQATNDGLVAVMGPRAEGLRMRVEARVVGDVPVFVVVPEDRVAEPGDPIYLDIHGGAFIAGGGEACRLMAQIGAGQVGIPTWSVDYRMPPDHPYPAALDDCIAVYRHLLAEHPPERIVVGGSSAGGNLAAALVLRARDEGLPLPAALVLLSPEADLTESGDSFHTNLGVDSVLAGSLAGSIALYAGGHDLRDPYLSPLFGEFTPPFPRTFLQTGTRDLFLSNTVRMHRRLRVAGVDAELHVFEAMPHGGFFGSPEDEELALEVRRFVASALPQ